MDPAYLAQQRASATRGEMRLKTIQQGAATSVLVATSPQLEGIGGHYFEDCNEARVLDPDAPHASESGVAAYAVDPEDAERLWKLSEQFVG